MCVHLIYHLISKSYYLSLKKVMPCVAGHSKAMQLLDLGPLKSEWKTLQMFRQIKVFEIFWKYFGKSKCLKIFWQIAAHCKNDFCNQFTAVDGDIVITGASNYSKCQLQYRALIVTIPRRCWWKGWWEWKWSWWRSQWSQWWSSSKFSQLLNSLLWNRPVPGIKQNIWLKRSDSFGKSWRVMCVDIFWSNQEHYVTGWLPR